jgi:hypothetical protein
VQVGADETSVDVTEGVVDVGRGGRHTLLHAGEGFRARPEREPPAREPETDADPAPAPPSEAPSDTAALLERVNEARRAGRLDEAAELLGEVIRRSGTAPGRASALLTLGRVERERGRLRAAAERFDECTRAGGPLTEDALASAARAWNDAGDRDAAAERARLYLERWPSGVHAPAMRALAD